MLIRLLIIDAHTPSLYTLLKVYCQQRWFKEKKPAKHTVHLYGFTFCCTSISYQPDLALRTTCSKSPPVHMGSVFLHESLAAPLDLKTRNTETVLHFLREATVDMYNKSPHVYHYGIKIHKLYFSEEKAEMQKSAIPGEG